ncbi:C6 transcription factor [Aspergillus heteromorphus CBS 117.55]|uniref:C6 transcription factor n=1 Tax=Aspergillus heteromorphus CBS 117.55 TaxID=1448321 RepID=A0A317WA28_9EURO|nr:C6 transcription factor [Aspergillus heteromorphus CBS 117.55]PWY82177.1 C6 transcription factor [Aspergillus heteromorphus CBS 117.55]
MSDNNNNNNNNDDDDDRPPPFPYPAYTSSSSNVQDRQAKSGGWPLPPFAHSSSSYGPPVSHESLPPSTAADPPAAGNSKVSVSEDRSLNSKVAIPRSVKSGNWSTSGRVSRACENCRDQKAKCTGHRPSCQRCQEAGIRCSYGDRKREKMAKQLSDLTSQVQAYEALFRELAPKLDLDTAHHVEQILTDQRDDLDQFASLQTTAASSASIVADATLVSIPSPGSSMAALDYTDEDFNRDERIQAMGFVGEHSEIAWLYRLKRLLERSNPVPPRDSRDHHSVASVNFFLDDSDLPVINDVDSTQRPPPSVADLLVDSYFQAVHPSLPIIGKMIFLGQYKSFYSSPLVRPGKKWLAILNLIFAIAAKLARDLHHNTDPGSDDSLVYFSRAWKLSMNETALLDHPNLQQVQVEGLTSFYLMSIGHVNRAWRICGISIRSAVTMGLNLRNESNSIVHVSKETRYRVWWSLYMLDNSLCVMTGRPPSTCDDFCTTPLPVPFREEDFMDSKLVQLIADHEARIIFMESLSLRSPGKWSESPSTPESFRLQSALSRQSDQVAAGALEALTPNTSLYFLHHVELALIIRQSVDLLYAPGTARKSWREIEMAISMLNGRADAWLARLPVAFHFAQGSPMFKRQRASLGFRFFSTKTLIAQPCLSRLALQSPGSDPPGSFCETMAGICVDVAGQMLDLLPDTPDLAWVYHVSPWWCILHYIMQSTTVLIAQILLRPQSGTSTYQQALARVSKATSWLAEMSSKDPASQRAWLVCKELIGEHAPEFGATGPADLGKT